MAGFYAALRRQNDAAPLADFATALHTGSAAHLVLLQLRRRARLWRPTREKTGDMVRRTYVSPSSLSDLAERLRFERDRRGLAG